MRMKYPSFLPEELSYYRTLHSEKELFEALRQESDEHMVQFFEYACEDENWAAQYGHLMRTFIKWFTDEYFEGRLYTQHSLRVAMTIQSHFKILEPYMYYDVDIFVEENIVPVNSLLFGAASPFFSEILRLECQEKGTKSLQLKHVTFPIFIMILEFVHTGNTHYLWRKNQEELFELLNQARAWSISELTELCAYILKRYLNEENALPMFKIAHAKGLIELRQRCLDFINAHSPSTKISGKSLPDDLEVEIDEWNDRSGELLKALAPMLSHLICRNSTAENADLCDLVKTCPKLKSLDLQGTSLCHPKLLTSIQNLRELNLSHCEWMQDNDFRNFVKRCPYLRKLLVANNPQLSYVSWDILAKLLHLAILDVSQCSQIGDVELAIIAASSPHLRELRLDDCRNITAKGITALTSHCKRLVELHIVSCDNIEETGFQTIAQECQQLNLLNLSHCGGLTKKALGMIASGCHSLQVLYVKDTPVSSHLVEQIRTIYPRLTIHT